MATRTYDPAQVFATFAGIPINGFAEGTFISASRDEDTFTKHTGAGGDVARTRNRNKGGKVSFTLMASSPTNDLLSAQAAADELAGTGAGALLVKDGNGSTVLAAPNAWISKPPAVEFGKELGDREWTIDCDELDMVIGGTSLA